VAIPVDNPSELAMLGGRPQFDRPLHVGRPNLGSREAFFARLNQALDRVWLTNDGPLVREFERQVEERLGVKHCVAMCNGTVALEIASRALNFQGEVIVPSFTFVATAHSLQWQGVTPVFCDIDPLTHNLDPAQVERLITPQTTGIVGVHLWGRPCDVDALASIAARHDLPLLLDASHAFSCTSKGRTVGQFGRAEVFSFHATKFLNACEGGAVVTNDDDLAQVMRLMRNFGFSGYDNVIYVGTNGKMSEVSAAMGLTNLDSMDAFVSANQRNYDCYRQRLADLSPVKLIEYDPAERNNYQYVVLEVSPDGGPNRDELLALLHAEGVLARRYFYPGVHRMEPYRSQPPRPGQHLPHTEALADQVISLPTGTSVTSEDVTAICGLIRYAFEHHEEIAELQRVAAKPSTGSS
jgi:dTDP-4-amino-4,6-dideoxygalactose transaminase